ncbi:MAG: twin-arginine translocase TatA/TatE family subunit [Deltaproteobacteria bacterium]|nr:twin-arginine translocase TatA/TatE family subunit [Deltaproteobacteria bacterium]
MGIWEVVVIVVVALIALGPRRLPELARQAGRVIRELRRTTHELRQSLDEIDPPEEPRPAAKPPAAPGEERRNE